MNAETSDDETTPAGAVPEEAAGFEGLPGTLRAALAERGYGRPTPVQAAVLGEGVAGRDLLVSARTGSGKTVAYGLAVAAELLDERGRLPRPGEPLALVVAPTRELALQVRGELSWLYAGARVAAAVGGTDPVAERRALAAGAQVVVGTPGRMRDHLARGNLRPGSVRAVVLDEADEMLDLGFREELEAILAALPEGRRTLMFSATVPAGIEALARIYQRDALRLAVATEEGAKGDIAHRAALVSPGEAGRAVVNAIRLEEPPIAMVFAGTRASVARLHGELAERGFPAVALSGELSQPERTRAIQSLRDGRARVCVATDVAARGLDLPSLDLVIHAELPRDPETLLHRAGRTGRAGRKGVSLLIVPPSRRRAAERLLAAAGLRAEWGPAPSAEAVRAADEARLLARARSLAAEAPGEEPDPVAEALAGEASPAALASALLRLLRAPLPAPEELTPAADRGPRPERREAPGAGGEGAWFRVGVGREGGADPRWLLPLLCRRGGVSRAEIGRIKVLARESRVEVAPWAASRFAAQSRRPAEGPDGRVWIAPLEGAGRG